MVKVERLNYKHGWQRLFYIVIGKESNIPSVHCYAPEGTKTEPKLKLFEAGVYYFKYYFGNSGAYVFIFFESGKKELIMIITVGR